MPGKLHVTADRAALNVSRLKTRLDVERGRIGYNALARLGGRAAGGAVSLIALHIGTHYFGPSRWGPIVAAVAFVAVFASASDFGVQVIASRELSTPGVDERALFGTALAAVPFTALPAIVVAVVLDLVLYAGHPEIRTLVLILVGTVPCTALWLVSASVFVARSRNDVRALLDLGSSSLVLGSIVVVAASRGGSDLYLLLVTLATALTSIAALLLARRYVVPQMRSTWASSWKLVKRSAPLGLTYSSNALYGQVDTILVALLTTTGALAAFGVASQVAGFVAAVPAMLMAAVTPHFMRKQASERQALFQRSFDALVLVAVVLPLLAALFAHSAVSAIAGGRYLTATIPLVLLVSASALAFPSAVFGHGLVLVGAERQVPRTVYAALAVNLVANLVAVPLDGITGAAFAMVVSEAALLVLRARSFRVATGFAPSSARAVHAVVAAGTLAALYVTCDLVLGVRMGHGVVALFEALAVMAAYAVLIQLAPRVSSRVIEMWHVRPL